MHLEQIRWASNAPPTTFKGIEIEPFFKKIKSHIINYFLKILKSYSPFSSYSVQSPDVTSLDFYRGTWCQKIYYLTRKSSETATDKVKIWNSICNSYKCQKIFRRALSYSVDLLSHNSSPNDHIQYSCLLRFLQTWLQCALWLKTAA